jgi:hypothetical protein
MASAVRTISGAPWAQWGALTYQSASETNGAISPIAAGKPGLVAVSQRHQVAESIFDFLELENAGGGTC